MILCVFQCIEKPGGTSGVFRNKLRQMGLIKIIKLIFKILLTFFKKKLKNTTVLVRYWQTTRLKKS